MRKLLFATAALALLAPSAAKADAGEAIPPFVMCSDFIDAVDHSAAANMDFMRWSLDEFKIRLVKEWLVMGPVDKVLGLPEPSAYTNKVQALNDLVNLRIIPYCRVPAHAMDSLARVEAEQWIAFQSLIHKTFLVDTEVQSAIDTFLKNNQSMEGVTEYKLP